MVVARKYFEGAVNMATIDPRLWTAPRGTLRHDCATTAPQLRHTDDPPVASPNHQPTTNQPDHQKIMQNNSEAPRKKAYSVDEIDAIAPTAATVAGRQGGGPGRGVAKHLRACLLCGVLRTRVDFLQHGCPNCDEYFDIRGQGEERMREVTSSHFEGMCAITRPDDSWVAKWMRVNKCAPGLYAVKVFGQLADEDVEDLERHGVVYRPRDGSALD